MSVTETSLEYRPMEMEEKDSNGQESSGSMPILVMADHEPGVTCVPVAPRKVLMHIQRSGYATTSDL